MLHHWGSEGEFYIGGFILLTFTEPVRLALNELSQYKTSYVCRTHLHSHNDVAFSSNYVIVRRRFMYVHVCNFYIYYIF